MRQLWSYLISYNSEILQQRLSKAWISAGMSSTSYTTVHLINYHEKFLPVGIHTKACFKENNNVKLQGHLGAIDAT